jgi:hypothetical protein
MNRTMLFQIPKSMPRTSVASFGQIEARGGQKPVSCFERFPSWPQRSCYDRSGNWNRLKKLFQSFIQCNATRNSCLRWSLRQEMILFVSLGWSKWHFKGTRTWHTFTSMPSVIVFLWRQFAYMPPRRDSGHHT